MQYFGSINNMNLNFSVPALHYLGSFKDQTQNVFYSDSGLRSTVVPSIKACKYYAKFNSRYRNRTNRQVPTDVKKTSIWIADGKMVLLVFPFFTLISDLPVVL
jgi:hypothetical protein